MVNATKIEWTDYTSNPVRFRRKSDGRVVHGCVKASEGCQHCYAESIARRFEGVEFTARQMRELEPFVDEKELRELLSPRKLPAGSKCFLGDMTDVFGEWVPFELLDRVFAVMALRPDVVFQVLTKRPERMRAYIQRHSDFPLAGTLNDLFSFAQMLGLAGVSETALAGWKGWPLPNVWLGTSAENQRWADVRIPELLATPAAVRFVSYEPALGPVDFATYKVETGLWKFDKWAIPAGLHWVIVGGESGPGARPFDIAWARSTVAQCRAAGVACFVKQLGAKPFEVLHEMRAPGPGAPVGLIGRTVPVEVPLKLKDRKGGDMEAWPEDLRVREMPGVTSA